MIILKVHYTKFSTENLLSNTSRASFYVAKKIFKRKMYENRQLFVTVRLEIAQKHNNIIHDKYDHFTFFFFFYGLDEQSFDRKSSFRSLSSVNKENHFTLLRSHQTKTYF